MRMDTFDSNSMLRCLCGSASPRRRARAARRRRVGPREIHTPIAHMTSAASSGRETSRLNTDRISMTQLTHKYTQVTVHTHERCTMRKRTELIQPAPDTVAERVMQTNGHGQAAKQQSHVFS